MFCQKCGHEIPLGAEFCPSCGTPVQSTSDAGAPPPPPTYTPPVGGQYGYMPPVPPVAPVSYEDADTLLKVASFFIPLVGIILYALDRDKKPVSAKSCLKMGVIGLVVWFAVPILIWLFMFLVVFGIGAFAAA